VSVRNRVSILEQAYKSGCNFCPFGVPRGTRGQNRLLVSFYDILKPPLILMMRCTVIFRKRVATLIILKIGFFVKVAFSISKNRSFMWIVVHNRQCYFPEKIDIFTFEIVYHYFILFYLLCLETDGKS
jgi:hypothetical protein